MSKKDVGKSFGESLHDLCYILTMLFCALRACDIITWKWYWVMSPIFISEIIGVIFLIIAGVIAVSIVKDSDK